MAININIDIFNFTFYIPQSHSHADEHSDREEEDMIREECESSDEGVNVNSTANENPLDFAKTAKHSNNNLR